MNYLKYATVGLICTFLCTLVFVNFIFAGKQQDCCLKATLTLNPGWGQMHKEQCESKMKARQHISFLTCSKYLDIMQIQPSHITKKVAQIFTQCRDANSSGMKKVARIRAPRPHGIGFKMRNNRMLAVRTTKSVNNNRNAKEYSIYLIEMYKSIYLNCVAVSL